jgi:uncharacterized integral membrane protein
VLRWLIGAVVVLGVSAGIVIGALNPEPVVLDLAAFQWSASLGTIAVAAFSVGLIAGVAAAAIAGLFRSRKRPPQASAGTVEKRLDNA